MQADQRKTGWMAAYGLLLLAFFVGCKTTAPMYVWQPSLIPTTESAKIAVAPVAGDFQVAKQLEQELLAQRPAAKADLALFTAEQLRLNSPVQLASTAPLTSDLAALKAARSLSADVLLHGQILTIQLEPEDPSHANSETLNMNQLFFQDRSQKEHKEESILMSWRVLDVQSGKTLGTKVFNLTTQQALEAYPDLVGVRQDETDLLLAASARETWKAIAPVVHREEVELSRPYLQPGAWGVRSGVRAAKNGDWATAERKWSRVVSWFPWSAPAHHNLALAKAAQEDFESAKQELQQATGIFAWRLPGETLFWLDNQHRRFNQAHSLPDPVGGWSFREPPVSVVDPLPATPVDIDELPWWTAIPWTKPPGWTWKGWLTQPLVL